MRLANRGSGYVYPFSPAILSRLAHSTLIYRVHMLKFSAILGKPFQSTTAMGTFTRLTQPFLIEKNDIL